MTETIETQLRAAMTEGSEHLDVPAGAAQRAWAFGEGARMERDTARPRSRGRKQQLVRWWRNLSESRLRLASAGMALTVVAVVIAAFALGGTTHMSTRNLAGTETGTADAGATAGTVPKTPHGVLKPTAGATSPGGGYSLDGQGNTAQGAGGTTTPGESLAGLQAHAPATNGGGSVATSGSSAGAPGTPNSPTTPAIGDSGVAATRVVKTGSLSITVPKGQVAATITKLTSTTTRLGGYVSQSRSNDVDGSPQGSLTLRIPVTQFENAVTAAAGLGKEISLVTNAHDVTGKFVDTNARLSALKRTRATYLTILGRARTIGQTLSVQQRVNDIQQHIESLQGELKVLRNQSADGTLTVDVAEAGSPQTTVVHRHHRSGFSKAWHTSTHRFNRGIQAIIGGLGPLLLALILLAVLYAVIRVAVRATKRV